MANQHSDLDPTEIELYDGSIVPVTSGDIWVTLDPETNGTLIFDSVLEITEIFETEIATVPLHSNDRISQDYPREAFRADALAGKLFPLPYVYENEETIRDDLLGESARSIPEMVMDVWGGFDEFEEYGPEYVTFLIEGDIREIRGEIQDQEEIDKEFTDIAINSIRALEEFGSKDARDLIEWRLRTRMDGDQDEIIERYVSKWTGDFHDSTEFRRSL